MSGIYIPDMEMPESCTYCPFTCKHYLMAKYALKTEWVGRHPRCPLIPVPDHGRLIDADVLFDKIPPGDLEHDKLISRTGAIADVCTWVLTAPTIFPADTGEEDDNAKEN